MCGPPGSGKSMLAMRLPGILPPLSDEEAIEVAAVASLGAAGFDARSWGRRPYRAPHHTAACVALVGGGSPRPGKPNAALGPKELKRDAALDAAAHGLPTTALERLSLSARAFHRVLKVARTIADLEGAEAVASAYVAEAVRYRQLDRMV